MFIDFKKTFGMAELPAKMLALEQSWTDYTDIPTLLNTYIITQWWVSNSMNTPISLE